jgi:hypothetical protein
VEPNPFFEPLFLRAAARQLERPAVSLLVAEDAAGWAACLPVERKGWHRARIPALATWTHMYSLLGTPLVRADVVPAAVRALVEFAREDRKVALFVPELMGVDGPVYAAIEELLAEEGRHPVLDWSYERAILRRRADSDYGTLLRGHHRREYQRQERALERDAGAPLELIERAGDESAVERFLELEAAGWKGRGGSALAALPGHDDMFREVCRGFAAAGRLQLLELVAGERHAAMKCNFRAGDAIFCFKIAFDEELRRYSPGVQMELANVDAFHASGAAWIDSCAEPHHTMIDRLWRDRRTIATLVIPGHGVRGRAAAAAVNGIMSLRRRLGRGTDDSPPDT